MNYLSRSQFKILTYKRELDRIAGWVEEYPNLETGGDLFGFWTHSGAPVIQFVLGPAPNSTHNQTSFYQGRDFLIEAGKVLRNKHGLQHIGEWHSHHQLGLAEPSEGDANTVVRALEKYEFPRFLLCIANLRFQQGSSPQGEVNVGGFLFARSKPGYEIGSWVLLPGESPIRENFKSSREKLEFLKYPKNKLLWNVQTSSLDAEVLITTEPAQVSENVWYASPYGKEILKFLFDGFKEKFNPCEMRRTGAEEIYFTFEVGKETWQVKLPNDFPQSTSILSNSSSKKNFDLKDVKEGKELLSAVENLLSDYYNRSV